MFGDALFNIMTASLSSADPKNLGKVRIICKCNKFICFDLIHVITGVGGSCDTVKLFRVGQDQGKHEVVSLSNTERKYQ